MLEWPLLVERLQAHLRTPGGRARCEPEDPRGLFADSPEAARERLAETSEARSLIERHGAALGDVGDVEPALQRAERGGALGPGELTEVASVLQAIHAVARLLTGRAEEAPRLASLASTLGQHVQLAERIGFTLDSEGQVRDAASPELAEARADTRRLSGELQRKLDAALHDPNVAPHLSDSFVTVRHDRYVLPVRADARGKVRGIVHDASASGTTLFVEPQTAVDLNNRLKEAELRIEREIARILRALSEQVGREAAAIRASIALLEQLDLAFARGALSREFDGVEPSVGQDGVLILPQLRHPLLPRRSVVPNDVRLGKGYHVLVLSGPNAGGKTVAMKSVALAALCTRAGLHIAADEGARVDWVDGILADIGDAQDLRESLSTFSAHLANLAHIVEEAGPTRLVVLDEIGDGTDPGEGAALAQAVLEALADASARVIVTTHYNLLKEMAAVDPRFENGSFEFDPTTLAPTYRLRVGVPGVSSAPAVAARMGLRRRVIDRANQLLQREDRRLERTLAELAESRLALDRERDEARALRDEAASERDSLRRKLEQLGRRRDRLYEEMRRDLESSFRRAHEEVATVVRQLQRGGGGRDAERARKKLASIERQAREAEERDGVSRGPAELEPLEWRIAQPGDRVRVAGGGEGVLESLPDRRGRVGVRVGSARIVVPLERVGQPIEAGPSERRANGARVAVERARSIEPPPLTGERCDLHGMRVDEALDRVDEALDRALLAGHDRLLLVHGRGTGALRKAVRQHLARARGVRSFGTAAPEDGGDGATEVLLEG